jgi:hypothetical protein
MMTMKSAAIVGLGACAHAPKPPLAVSVGARKNTPRASRYVFFAR